MTVTPQDAIDAAHAALGDHPGHRALHAKGTLLKGTLPATPQAARLTPVAHMQGEPVRVTARVSNGGAIPRSPTTRPTCAGWR